jgi:hypothetical protein
MTLPSGGGTANHPLVPWERVLKVLSKLYPDDVVQETLLRLVKKFGNNGLPAPLLYAKRLAGLAQYEERRAAGRRWEREKRWSEIYLKERRLGPDEVVIARETARQLHPRLVEATLFGYNAGDVHLRTLRFRARASGLLEPVARRHRAATSAAPALPDPESLESTDG